MERWPLTPASAGSSNLKIKFSQSEVQRLIEQEVHSAVNETKLQALIESVQQLENAVSFERSIETLQVQVNRLSKRAEVALAYVSKMQKQNAVPSPVGVNAEERNMETVSQNSAKHGELFQMMETTRNALKKMRADSQALMAATADLNEGRLHPTSDSPFENERVVSFIKTEPDDERENENSVEFKQLEKPKAQRVKIRCAPRDTDGDTEQDRRGAKRTYEAARTDLNEEQLSRVLTPHWPLQLKQELKDEKVKENIKVELTEFEEPKSQKVKTECVSPVSTNSHRCTEQNGFVLPSLPPTPFPSVLNMEAALYSIPQMLEVNLALIRKPISLSVLWKVAEEDPSAPPMDSYTIFLTMEKVKGSGVFPDWNILGEVKALNLPMCVLVKKYKPGHKLCAAVVGKDIFGRYGPYSKVATAVIPE